MSMNMSAHKASPPPAFEVKDVIPPSPVDLMRGYSPTVVVRVLSKAEIAAIAAEPRLPELNWRAPIYLVLEMIKPWRTFENHNEDWWHYDHDPDNTIEHEWFVKAHEALPFIETEYYNHILLTTGEPSKGSKGDQEAFGRRYFDMARNYVRECALNGYYATYG